MLPVAGNRVRARDVGVIGEADPSESCRVAQPFFGTRDPRTVKPARRLLRVATSGPRQLTILELDGSPGDVAAAGGAVWIGAAGGVGRITPTWPPLTFTQVVPDLVPNRIETFRDGAWWAPATHAG